MFDVCHGCRRCFNLCQSFPTLFDMIDNSPSGELNSVDSSEFKKVRGLWYQSCLQWPTHVCAYSILQVSDECTLCDMCFINKCANAAVAAVCIHAHTGVHTLRLTHSTSTFLTSFCAIAPLVLGALVIL